jgi:hypothetical protein
MQLLGRRMILQQRLSKLTTPLGLSNKFEVWNLEWFNGSPINGQKTCAVNTNEIV